MKVSKNVTLDFEVVKKIDELTGGEDRKFSPKLNEILIEHFNLKAAIKGDS